MASNISEKLPDARIQPAPLGSHQQPINDLLKALSTTEAGLTSAEAERRIGDYGPNEPEVVRRASPLTEFLHFCTNPLVLILLVASMISAFLGELLNAAIIGAMVVLSVVVNFVQAYRSEQAVKRLREQVAPTASVLRDGDWQELPRRVLVPGDVIRLSAGDLVPGDARLISSRDLHLQQAALTGESMPVDKAPGTSTSTETLLDSEHCVFVGTSVVSGSARAVVFATSRNTAFGDIALRLAKRRPETEFDRGVRQFGMLIMETVIFLVLFILVVNLAMHRNALESLLFAVALAVGLTPEFLPMITTVTLSTGAVRMARKNVIVKHLAAIQNFGSIDVLCTDKTGTLTTGEMILDHSVDAFGEPSARALFLAYLNSHFETGIKSPLDTAITRAPAPPGIDGYRKTDEIPFDFERRRLSISVEKENHHLLITKGAPESILAVSTSCEVGGNSQALDELSRKRCEAAYRKLSARGLRVLAVAFRPGVAHEGTTVDDERDMTLAGFLAFVDPPREGAAASLAALRRDGVTLKVVTGDNELVTRNICERVGIGAERLVLGSEIDHISDSALAQIAEQTDVFARVSPAHKNRIIMALKSRSHVVGFLGDGINDAPSLHSADVGISVHNAVDVAREAAEIILLQPGLDVLHSGIVEGRKAFGNVMKYLLMGTSSNFGNMFSMAGAVVFLPFLPMLPTQILLNNFLYDLSQLTIPTDNVDPAYIVKPQHWHIGMIRNFMVLIGPISSIYDFLTFYVLLRIFHSSEALFHTGWFVESLATQTLVLFVIRTAGPPWSNRPSIPLMMTTILVVLIGGLLPFTSLARPLGFVPLPGAFFLFLAGAIITYLLLVELTKRRLIGRLFAR
jgi:P-type Mg2+ transporter